MKKIPLVLCPGLLCDAALWEPQLEALADVADFWIPDLTGQETMRAMGEAVLRDAPWKEFALAGLSMGGYVALETVRLAPQRVGKLALLDSRSGRKRRRIPSGGNVDGSGAKAGGFAPVISRMLPVLVHPSRVKEEPLVKIIRDMAERTGVEAYVRQQKAIISRDDYRPGLKDINVPTLVLCGREDQLTPLDCSEEMAAAIPGATLVVIERCGHMSTLEKPGGQCRVAALAGSGVLPLAGGGASFGSTDAPRARLIRSTSSASRAAVIVKWCPTPRPATASASRPHWWCASRP
jgi:pimeloyl-ACP methyl ester carboxylesterase